MCKLWLHVRGLHERINLDFNLQYIYIISSLVTVTVKFLSLVARLAKINIAIWVISPSCLNDLKIIDGYEIWN